MSFWKLLFSHEGDFLCYDAQDTHTHIFCLLRKPLALQTYDRPSPPSRCNREVNLPHLLSATKVSGSKRLKCDNHCAIWYSKVSPSFDSLHRDGLISKDEMMAYFLRAKSQLHCKMGPGFIHNFQEMTYLKPTFCEHCAGFVSLSLTDSSCL